MTGAVRRVSIEKHQTLPPEPGSAGASRRLLREVLVAAGLDRWVDVGELAISELVTNAALHAHTDIDVSITVHDDEVEVGVRDRNPVLPVLSGNDDEATTGRGLALVTAITAACGVRAAGDDGKVAWFCLRDEPDPASADPLEAWDLDPADAGPATPSADAVTVVLAPMPVTLWVAARQHHDAILRELVLYLAEHDDVAADLVGADRARGRVSAAVQRWVDGAGADRDVADGAGPTLEVSIPAGAGADVAALRGALDVAEELALAGKLLAHPGLAEVVAVRNWVFDEIIAQLAGAPATPWSGVDRLDFETDVRAREGEGGPAWDATEVRDAERGVVAADDANRIVAVSRSLAALLGWRPEELIGRRVVTIIPPALREAHVAGFSRHLSTGESHILGRSLQVPVLRRDGTEVVCDLRLERSSGVGRPSLYLAWIDAVGAGGAGPR